MIKITCGKCNGTGRYAHHGVCFACGGNGRGRIGKFGPARVETAEEITAREASALETLRDIYRSGRSDSDAWEIATCAICSLSFETAKKVAIAFKSRGTALSGLWQRAAQRSDDLTALWDLAA